MIVPMLLAVLAIALGGELGILMNLDDEQVRSEGFFPEGALASIDGPTWAIIIVPAVLLGMIQYITSLFDSAAWLSWIALVMGIAAEAIYGFWMLSPKHGVNRPRELVLAIPLLAISFGLTKQAIVSMSLTNAVAAGILSAIVFWATIVLVAAVAVSAAISYFETVEKRPAPVVPILMACITLAVGGNLVGCVNDSQALVPSMTEAWAAEAGSDTEADAVQTSEVVDSSVKQASADLSESSETQAVYNEPGVAEVLSDGDPANNNNFGPAVDISGMTPEEVRDLFLEMCHNSVLTGTTAMATSDAVFGWNTLGCDITVNNVNGKMKEFYENPSTYQDVVDKWEDRILETNVSFVDGVNAECMWAQYTAKANAMPCGILINCNGEFIVGPLVKFEEDEKGIKKEFYARPECDMQTLIGKKIQKLVTETVSTPVEMVQKVRYVKAYCASGGGRGDYSGNGGGGVRVVVRPSSGNVVNNNVTNVSNTNVSNTNVFNYIYNIINNIVNNNVVNNTTVVNNNVVNNNWYQWFYQWWIQYVNNVTPQPPTPPIPPTPDQPTPPGPDQPDQPVKDPTQAPDNIGGNIEGEGTDPSTNNGVGSEESSADTSTGSGNMPSYGDYTDDQENLDGANQSPNAGDKNPENKPTTGGNADNEDSGANTGNGNGAISDATDVSGDPVTGEVGEQADDILSTAIDGDIDLGAVVNGDATITDGTNTTDEAITYSDDQVISTGDEAVSSGTGESYYSGDEAIVEDSGVDSYSSDDQAIAADTIAYSGDDVVYYDGGSSDESYDYSYDSYDGGSTDTVETYDYSGSDYVDYSSDCTDYSVDCNQGGDVLSFDVPTDYAESFELAA